MYRCSRLVLLLFDIRKTGIVVRLIACRKHSTVQVPLHVLLYRHLYYSGCPPTWKTWKSGNLTLVREFDIGQGKVGEIVVCLWCATAVATVTK